MAEAPRDQRSFLKQAVRDLPDGSWAEVVVAAEGVEAAPAGADAANVKSVPVSTLAVTALPANPARKGVTIVNDSTSKLRMRWGGTATRALHSVVVSAGGYYESPASNPKALLSLIWDSEDATGKACVTEYV